MESWVALRFTSTSAPQPSAYAKCPDKESEKLRLMAMVTTRGDSTNSETKVENIRHDSEGEGGRKQDEIERQGRRRGAEEEVVGTLALYIC